ncbi:MAG: TRAP transporter large permease subunit [Candidatus Binatia bacterium]
MLEFVQEFSPLLMFLCLAVLLFSGYPVAFVLGGVGLAFGFIGMAFGTFSFPEFNNIVLRVWGGVAENLLLVAVPMFVFMGIMLERSGVAENLLHTMQLMLASVRGGLAMAVTVMGTILAASTGIIGASVVMMGVLALPAMLNRKYQTELAVGTICASGTLGILIPPSIMLVLMGDLLSISVGELFIGALFPGLILTGLYILYIGTIAILRPEVAPPVSLRERQISWRELTGQVVKSFIPPVVMILLVLGSIFAGWATPTEASGVGAFGAMLLAIVNRRFGLDVLKDVLYRSALTISLIFMILIGATTFSYVYRSLGGDEIAEAILLGLALGPWGILFFLMGVIFFLGFFFDWIEITLIVLPLFGPIVSKLDLSGHLSDPQQITLWFALLVAINLQTSFLTPPFGFALFYLKGVSPPEVTTGHLYRGIIPFVGLQLIGLTLVMMFPKLVTWLPSVLLQ